jgi:hypothetical protein
LLAFAASITLSMNLVADLFALSAVKTLILLLFNLLEVKTNVAFGILWVFDEKIDKKGPLTPLH